MYDRIGNNDTLQFFTIHECVSTNADNRVGNLDAGHIIAIRESFITNGRNGILHTIVDKEEKPSRETHSETYFHVQAIAEGLGLIVYSTSSRKMMDYLRENEVPIRDRRIAHDWRGYYYEGTVYTDEEEETMIREKYNIY